MGISKVGDAGTTAAIEMTGKLVPDSGSGTAPILLAAVCWQQLWLAGIFMLPHWPFICRQQACSAAVICDPGNAQVIVGASSDNSATNAAPIRGNVCIYL